MTHNMRGVWAAVALSLVPLPARAQGVGSVGTPPGSTTPVVAGARQDYVIGPDDVLTIVFWRDKEMSGDVVVRPDGKISLPLLRDIQAAGLTPDQLRQQLVHAATEFLEEPEASVVVKEIHSRNVFITGNVAKPGTYALAPGMNVLQALALAGGLLEYADSKKIVIIRDPKRPTGYYMFNYDDVVKLRKVEQNIELRPSDTVVVP